MSRVLFIYFICVSVLIGVSRGVSTKMDFGEDEEPATIVTNSSRIEDEDVEVKHTIVVSTKLKNNNRRGLHSNNDGGTGALTYKIGAKEDSGEVPVVNGYKAVDSTLIRTPDTRQKKPPGTQYFPESVFINRNLPDEYDIYPNYINNPTQWKPSTLYTNINWLNQDIPLSTDFNPGFKSTLIRPAYQIPGKFHRRITDDGMKEFYCNKCRELRGCGQQRSNIWTYTRETTTPKMKLDGKLAKLN